MYGNCILGKIVKICRLCFPASNLLLFFCTIMQAITRLWDECCLSHITDHFPLCCQAISVHDWGDNQCFFQVTPSHFSLLTELHWKMFQGLLLCSCISLI